MCAPSERRLRRRRDAPSRAACCARPPRPLRRRRTARPPSDPVFCGVFYRKWGGVLYFCILMYFACILMYFFVFRFKSVFSCILLYSKCVQCLLGLIFCAVVSRVFLMYLACILHVFRHCTQNTSEYIRNTTRYSKCTGIPSQMVDMFRICSEYIGIRSKYIGAKCIPST